MEEKKYPILEYDESAPVIEPGKVIKKMDIPEHGVICFFKEVIDNLIDSGKTNLITNLKSEMGLHPIYEIEFNGKKVLLFHPGVGAPLAAALLEEVIALGANKFIACGKAGVLDKDIAVGHLIIPQTAIRDEGTSYHYLPPSREVEASKEGIKAIESILKKHKVKYLLSKTWTTDAFYRETIEKIKQRKLEGCLTVEMESSAFFAVAKHRKITLAQILYGDDDLSCEEWDSRGDIDRSCMRENIFWLAVESCLEISG